MTKQVIDEKVLNAVRCRRYRRKHRKEYNKKMRDWSHAHPERKKEIVKKWCDNNKEQRKIALQKWRKDNPDKLRKQRLRIKNKRRAHRYHYQMRKGVTVAVTCIVCESIILTKIQKGRRPAYCDGCRKKMAYCTPKKAIYDINNHPSFKPMDNDLLAWKRITEIRKKKLGELPFPTISP